MSYQIKTKVMVKKRVICFLALLLSISFSAYADTSERVSGTFYVGNYDYVKVVYSANNCNAAFFSKVYVNGKYLGKHCGDSRTVTLYDVNYLNFSAYMYGSKSGYDTSDFKAQFNWSGNVLYYEDCKGYPAPREGIIKIYGYTKSCGTIDWGDALNSYGTLSGSNGARHKILNYDEDSYTSPLMLGDSIDAENNGEPGYYANGDDNTEINDEDGVMYFPTIRARCCKQTYKVPLIVNNRTNSVAYLYGWIDFNCNGKFDSNEFAKKRIRAKRIRTRVKLKWKKKTIKSCSQGYNARFRLTTDRLTSTSATGYASNGEVEDYLIDQ